MIFCSNCEEWVEAWEGRCPFCNRLLKRKKRKSSMDEFEENDMEWGTEDEGEEFNMKEETRGTGGED